jgi:glycosyltransferase involved in cell wall biosynthesis
MRIVIDLQGAQTESSKRGIGRYSLSIALAIARNRGKYDLLLALNGLFPDTIEPIRAAFDGLLPQDQIRVFDVPGPVRANDPDNAPRRRKAELIREAFLAGLDPDAVLLTSLFEGYVDDAVTSIGRLAQTRWPTATVLYDLIPLAMPREIFANAAHRAWYDGKIDDFQRSDLFLAISEYSRREGLDRLNLPADRVTNISTAADECFCRLDISAAAREACLAPYGIVRPFVFYAGGFDPRKNVERAIRAFATLPAELRRQYQFVLAGGADEAERIRLRAVAENAGLKSKDYVLTGRVAEHRLIALYNLCAAFIFPSLNEGFGLPALEAMACGAPTIASNASGVPEVVGFDQALFDPQSEADIARLLGKTLSDAAFRARLRENGLAQARKFSWDGTARRALEAIERAMKERKAIPEIRTGPRPRLAFVSPLPPERTGIAAYSADLLPALSRYYEIVLITDQKEVDVAAIGIELAVYDSAWLRANRANVARVIYQMGNSAFHDYMRDLIREIPGTVVLHDFFLSGLFSWLEQIDTSSGVWTRALYQSHGYIAVRDRYHDAEMAKMRYPVNLGVAQAAQGVVVHSEHARTLAKHWLGSAFAEHWKVIPQLQKLAEPGSRASAREAIGVPQDAFVLCSFGILDPSKLNHRLLDAFLVSSLMRDAKCYLVFVGENHPGDYGTRLLDIISANKLTARVRITGWVDPSRFQDYLAAADLAVQLRSGSRGETSRALLDCLNARVPVIANAHGSMAELPADAVCMLDDEFSDAELIAALETLYQNPERGDALRRRGREVIATGHTPEICARYYAEAIETFHAASRTGLAALVDAVAAIAPPPDETDRRLLSRAIAKSLPTNRPVRRLLLDITASRNTALKTGIERAARGLILALLEKPPAGFRIEPVYLTEKGGYWHYRYASRLTLDLLGCPPAALSDDAAELQAGDVVLGLDNSVYWLIDAEADGLFAELRRRGLSVYFTVYDLLPLQLPQYFPPGRAINHERWLSAVLQMDGALCISRRVADDLHDWARHRIYSRLRPFRIGSLRLGADIANAAPTRGLPDDAAQTLAAFAARPSFLMVGTIEPRKGYMPVLDAFDQLWSENVDVNLIVVGAEGWRDLRRGMRRSIPQIVARLQSHSERGRRLFWLNGPSDEYLEKIYAASSCLIAASEGEGFGLPLVEAARHGLPIMARDLPVFREVTGESAFYFAAEKPDLARAIKEWLELYYKGTHPRSDAVLAATWAQSVEQIKDILFAGEWYASIPAANAKAAEQEQRADREREVLVRA